MKKLNVALINPPSIAYKNLLDKFTKTTSAQSKEVYSMPIGILHLLPCIERIEETDKLAVLDYALECLNISEEKSLEDFIDRVAAKLDFGFPFHLRVPVLYAGVNDEFAHSYLPEESIHKLHCGFHPPLL